MKIRKILGMAILFLALAGCSGESRSEKKEAAESEKKITVMCPGYSAADLMDYWEKEKLDFRLEEKTYPEEQYYTVLKTRLAIGNAADILDIQLGYAGPNGVEELGAAGYLEPLYDVPEDYPEDNPEHLLIADGKVYGKSPIRMMLGVGINKALFRQYNLAIPGCWEDFLVCCEQLEKAGIRPLVTGGKDATVFQYGVYQIAANRLYPKDPAYDEALREGTARFTDEGTWDEILLQYLSLFRDGYMGDDYLRLRNSEALELFASGEAAMIITTTLSYSSVITPEHREDFGFIPLPANPKGEPLCISESLIGGFGVYSGSSEKEFLVEKMKEYCDGLAFNDLGSRSLAGEEYKDCPAYYFCNQGWPNEVEVVMEKKIQEYLAGGLKGEISGITRAMQAELEK